MTHKHSEAHLVSTVKQLSIPLLDEELPHSHLIVILRQPNQISYNTSCR